MLKRIKLPDWLGKYGIALILLAVPLYPKFPLVKIPGTYVAIRLEDFLLAILTLIFLVLYLPQIKTIFQNQLGKSILIFLGIGLLSLFSGIFLTQTVKFHLGILHWFRRVEYFSPFFIGLFYFSSKKGSFRDLEFFVKVLMVAVVVIFIYGLGQKYLNWPVIVTQNKEFSKGIALRWVPGGHINSTFAGHYDLASFLVLVLPLFISLLLTLRGRWTKISLLGVIIAGLWLLANSLSRISVVSYFLATAMALFLLKKYREIIFVFVGSLLVFILSSSLLARYMQIFKVLYQKIIPIEVFAQESAAQIAVFEDRSTSIRLKMEWPRALRAFKKNPFLGTGYSSITLATDNDFLRLLGETGILGFLAFALILWQLFKVVRKGLGMVLKLKPIEKGFVVAYGTAYGGILLNAFFIDIFEASKFAIIFWLLTGLFVSLVRNYKYE